jgi:hypothetical protein
MEMDYLKNDDILADEKETAATGAAEIRLLNDLELVLAGGGDGIAGWP